MNLPKITFILFLLLSINYLKAQNNNNDTLANRKDAINFYISCDYCDMEYFKKEITLINYVRDRKASDIHLIISSMDTGGGGTEYSLQFIGKGKFKNLSDTVIFSLSANTTENEEREALLENIKKGLTPFILKTPLASKINIQFQQDKISKELVKDKWNSWVFKASTSGFANGEDVYTNYNFWSNISASKVTPDIKIEINYHNNYNKSIYHFSSKDIESSKISNNLSLLITKSVGKHWAIGGFSNIYSSTYSNIETASSISPAVEYNVFKYSEAVTKQLRFLYKINATYNHYIDTTIFNKIEEYYGSHLLDINYKNIQEWGSIEASI